MNSAERFALIEERKALRLAEMRQAEADRRAKRARIRESQRVVQVLDRCWLCGSKNGLPQGLTRFQLPLPLGTIDGVLCQDCRNVKGDMPEVVTRRLWTTDLPARWGWVPIPSKQTLSAVRMGYAVDRDGDPVNEISWTVAEPWHAFTWAHHLLEHRRIAEAEGHAKERDPQLPRRPFDWLT
jgi:hypothetical protein